MQPGVLVYEQSKAGGRRLGLSWPRYHENQQKAFLSRPNAPTFLLSVEATTDAPCVPKKLKSINGSKAGGRCARL